MGVVISGKDSIEFFSCVNECRGHTELTHVLKHDAVVCGVDGAFEVLVHYVDILVVDFSVLNHHDDEDECVMDVAKEAEAILLFAAVSFFYSEYAS
jgi:hypothetical protein